MNFEHKIEQIDKNLTNNTKKEINSKRSFTIKNNLKTKRKNSDFSYKKVFETFNKESRLFYSGLDTINREEQKNKLILTENAKDVKDISIVIYQLVIMGKFKYINSSSKKFTINYADIVNNFICVLDAFFSNKEIFYIF